MSQEQVTLLSDGDITVTNALLTIGGKTYPIRNISAVEVQHTPQRRSGAQLAGFAAICSVLVQFAVPDSQSAGGLVIFGALAVFLWHRGRPISTLTLNTSGKDNAALKDHNQARVLAIAAAINEALARQHR